VLPKLKTEKIVLPIPIAKNRKNSAPIAKNRKNSAPNVKNRKR
jgi:hypothetical protein